MAARPNQQPQLDRLTGLIAAAPDGLALEQLMAAAGADIPRNTLLRRLQTLIAEGVIEKIGVSRAARYRILVRPPAHAEARHPVQDEMLVPLSKPAGDILRQVNRPVQARKPVGYNREFLDSYTPNRSSYLTASERKKLADLSVTSMPVGPAGTYAQHILDRLLIDLSWNSSRLEGNTYSLLDTERLIQLGEVTEARLRPMPR